MADSENKAIDGTDLDKHEQDMDKAVMGTSNLDDLMDLSKSDDLIMRQESEPDKDSIKEAVKEYKENNRKSESRTDSKEYRSSSSGTREPKTRAKHGRGKLR